MFKDHPCHAPVQVGFDALLLCDDEDLREIGLLKGPRVKILRKKRRPPLPSYSVSCICVRNSIQAESSGGIIIIGWSFIGRSHFPGSIKPWRQKQLERLRHG